MTQKQNVLAAFQSGEELTPKQIASRFNVANVNAVINSLRMEGYPIYLNAGKKGSDGTRLAARYRLGTPTRKVIAAGYKALASRGPKAAN